MNETGINQGSDGSADGVHRDTPPETNDHIDADAEVDATGLICPEPLMLVRNAVRALKPGQVVHVTATDPAASRDFRDFCRFMGHALVVERESDAAREFWIRKG